MNPHPDSIVIDGVTYVPAADRQSGDWVIVRSRDAGVFLGELVSRDGSEVVLHDARRLWYWAGAATLSQLAKDGTSKPSECKFPDAVSSITILGVCEIIPATSKAVASLSLVKVWKE